MLFAEIKAVKGVRNDVGPERFATGDLRYGRNIDIDETGKAFRRRGVTTVQAGAAHSGWSDGTQALFVQGGVLKRMTPDGVIAAVSPSVTITGTRVSFVQINGRVYWADGVSRGVVTGGQNAPWGITPPPKLQPTVGGGNLPAGRYLCTMTYVSDDGSESGAPPETLVQASTTGGIQFSDLPVSAEPGVVRKNIYVSPADTSTPMLVGTISNASTTFSLTEFPDSVASLRTALMQPAPVGGQLLGYYNGRAYVGIDKFLCYSQPFEYSLFDPRDFLAFDSFVQTFAAVRDGIFVGTKTRTVFLSGSEPSGFISRPISPYGTVLGTETVVPSAYLVDNEDNAALGNTSVLWTSVKGVVLGSDGGVTRDLTAARYIPPAATTGAALIKRRDGTTPQYLVSLAS